MRLSRAFPKCSSSQLLSFLSVLSLSAFSSGCGAKTVVLTEPAPQLTYVETVLADAPMAYWRLNDLSGLVAKDSTANARDAAYHATTVLAQPGPIHSDTASLSILDTDNGSTSVLFANTFMTAGTNLTLEIWHKTTSDNINILFYVGNGASRGFGFDYRVLSTFSRLELLLGNLAFNALTFVDGSPGYSGLPDTWAYYVLTRDDTTWKLYIDGAGPVATGTQDPFPILGTDSIQIGQCKGSFAEAAIYDKALTLEQVQAHYKAAGY